MDETPFFHTFTGDFGEDLRGTCRG